MKALALRSGLPGVRLGPALAASLALHLALLMPFGWLARKSPASPPPPLLATLQESAPVTELATQPEAERVPPPAAQLPMRPAPTFQKEVPKQLTGRALNTALAALTREEFYPRAAIVRGLEGRVVLLLTLDAAGRVTAVEVASGSGHALLDAAALKAAARIGSLPGGRRQALLPVEFRLE
ncbi:MAG: TonB family protein [Rhodocyclaceae bacterium]|nr:TonB family protein [Rhodocyclaceae bacterium]